MPTAACTEYGVRAAHFDPGSGGQELDDVEFVDRIVQVPADQADVLWVIDNSCSMRGEQSALAFHFPIFMRFFLNAGALDYHVGVISTDMDAPDHRGQLREVSGHRWIDAETPAPTDTFAAMAEMGTFGSGAEKGIASAHTALVTLRDTVNDGFLRTAANLHVIVISDENDHTVRSDGVTPPGFAAYLNALKDTRQSVTFSSIVNPADCFCPPWESNRAGHRYLELTDDVGGITWDIQGARWDYVLEALGVAASGLGQEFYLSRLPSIPSIEVLVVDDRGREAAFVEGDDWAYDRIRNSVIFHDFVPTALSEIFISYTELSSLTGS